MKPPIPPHLAAYSWYARHQAWLKSAELEYGHEPPPGVMGEAFYGEGEIRGPVDLSGAYLAQVNLSRCALSHANFSGADLRYAWLMHSDLFKANFSGARLWSVGLNYSNLEWANLSGADLEHADLSSTKLGGARLVGASLDHVIGLDRIRDGVIVPTPRGDLRFFRRDARW